MKYSIGGFLMHTTKGVTWKDHKYVDIVNGRYIYPEDLEKANTTSTTRSAAKLSDEGKQIWNAVKTQIKDEKKNKQEIEKNTQTKTIEGARAKAQSTRESISNSLSKLKEELSARLKSQKTELSNAAKAEREGYQNDAKQKREQCAAELKASIEAARAAYKKAKETLDTNYEKQYQDAYDDILSRYAKSSTRGGSSSRDTTGRKKLR